MKCLALIFVACALCALTFADDTPAALNACSFRLTAHIEVTSVDGDVLAKSLNEIIRDNGDHWVWKSDFEGNEFISSIVPDHEWAIIWRPETGKSYRHDIMAQKCYESTDLPTPFKWIESKTYGIVWFDEPVWYYGEEATLYTAVSSGAYGKYKFETTAAFYVTNKDQSLVHMNGTVTANNKEIEVYFSSTALSFEHNKEINPNVFAVQAPCTTVDPPSEPSDEFKKKCYHASSEASFTVVSWLALLMALVASLLYF